MPLLVFFTCLTLIDPVSVRICMCKPHSIPRLKRPYADNELMIRCACTQMYAHLHTWQIAAKAEAGMRTIKALRRELGVSVSHVGALTGAVRSVYAHNDL